jgi:hypothetical protein
MGYDGDISIRIEQWFDYRFHPSPYVFVRFAIRRVDPRKRNALFYR